MSAFTFHTDMQDFEKIQRDAKLEDGPCGDVRGPMSHLHARQNHLGLCKMQNLMSSFGWSLGFCIPSMCLAVLAHEGSGEPCCPVQQPPTAACGKFPICGTMAMEHLKCSWCRLSCVVSVIYTQGTDASSIKQEV